MQITVKGNDIYLDGLVLECILNSFCASDLAILATVCRDLRSPVRLAARRTLADLMRRLQCVQLRHYERGSLMQRLAEWEALEAANKIWLQADPSNVTLIRQGDADMVKHVADLSGHGNGAFVHQRMPTLTPNAVNGFAAFEFDGASVLKTRPFPEPLQQPITLVVVAKARGDTTIVDSLGPDSSRFELCHGYPTGWHPSPEICMSASGSSSTPRQSLRGSTRSMGEWHVYTAIFDYKRSEIYVDGYCEASGKNIGCNSLDGLSIGCDHCGVFYLTGALAELRVFGCRMEPAQRVQTEAALAHRYGISYSCVPAPPSPPSHSSFARSLSRFSCAPRSPARTSEVLE